MNCILSNNTIRYNDIHNDTIAPIVKMINSGVNVNDIKIVYGSLFMSHYMSIAKFIIYKRPYPKILKYLLDNNIDLSNLDSDKMINNIIQYFNLEILQEVEKQGYKFTTRHTLYACKNINFLANGDGIALYLINTTDITKSTIIYDIIANTKSTNKKKTNLINAVIQRNYQLTSEDMQLISLYPEINNNIIHMGETHL